MPRTIKTAAIQLDAAPAPTAVRLQRAADQVASAAKEGAQLIVLPEIFNTGYAYTHLNHHLAEPMDGPTVTWLKTRPCNTTFTSLVPSCCSTKTRFTMHFC
jgi:predicted amidohydrolase